MDNQEITVTSVSFVNTQENMALPESSRKVVVSLSNNTDRVLTRQQALNMIAAATRQQAEAASMGALATEIKTAIDALIGE